MINMPKLNEMPTICDQLVGEVIDSHTVEYYDSQGYEPSMDYLWESFKSDLAILKENGFQTVYNENEPPGKCVDVYYRIKIRGEAND